MSRIPACLAFFIVALGLTACGAKKIKLNQDNGVTNKGVVNVWAAVVKDRKTRYDAQMHFRNEHAKGILFAVEDIHCFRGAGEGVIHRMAAASIALEPGQERSFNFICQNVPTSGGLRFVISKVYENPTGDGATRGAVIATNVEWKD